jgi:PadR family transcriptional regulator, regulatory protein AphA
MMSLKHAILGFLSFKPFSGYDLKKAFDNSIQHFWPANQSQIYRTLAELSEAGLVEMEVIPREDRLDMKIYHITPVGGEELRRWLSKPLPVQDYREPFLIQVYFGARLPDPDFINLLRQEAKALEERLAVYQAIYARYQAEISGHPDPRAYFLSMTTLEYGILSNQVSLDWLNSTIQRVQNQNYTLRDFQQAA